MSDVLADLPPELRRLLGGVQPAQQQFDQAKLDRIGIEIGRKRDEAKMARASSNIEQVWIDAEEAYEGIDNANRHEGRGVRWQKPQTTNAPLYTKDSPQSSHQSTVGYRLTARYVDAGAAKVQEILVPADDKAFNFKGMPAPQLIKAKDAHSHQVNLYGEPQWRDLKPGEQPKPGVLKNEKGQVWLTVADVAEEQIKIADDKAKAAETRIYNWMLESGFRREYRKIIRDSAKIGTGALKGPFPKEKRVATVLEAGGETEVIIEDKILRACERVSVWNIFPDPSCGDDIHNGDYIFERDRMSARQVRGLKHRPGFIARQIDKVLKEGPDKSRKDDDGRDDGHNDQYTVWYFYGMLSKDEVEAINSAGAVKGFDANSDSDEHYVIAALINDTVVQATINLLSSGKFPFHLIPWQERNGHWAGVGVAEQMKDPQRIVNAALRAMLNNAGKSSDNQYIIDQGALHPADGSMTITPGKVWTTTKDFVGDVRTAMMAIQIPNTGDAMEKIIVLAERMAEQTTSIPLVSQGQSGPTTPDTYGATQLQDNNANQLLRAIGYAFDDYVTEPVVTMYYEMFLLDPDVPSTEKGEFEIDAHGSVALTERYIQNQQIAQMAQIVAQPVYKADPAKWYRQWCKSQKLDPDDFTYTEEEQAAIDAQAAPAAPQIEVAKINQDTQLKLGVMKQQDAQQSLAHEQQIAKAAQALEGQSLQVQSTLELHKGQQEHERALMEAANKLQIELSRVKAQLADTAMKLQVEQQLNEANQLHEAHQQERDRAHQSDSQARDHANARDGQSRDQAHEAGQSAEDRAHEADRQARDRTHEADQSAEDRAHADRQQAESQSVDLYKHRHPSPVPAVQVPGRARNGQASSQAT